MSYIYDAIMESNKLEDESIKEIRKNTPSLKRKQFIKDEKELDECSKTSMKEEQPLEESTLTEDKLVDIENYLEPENYIIESVQDSKEVIDDNDDIDEFVEEEFDTERER